MDRILLLIKIVLVATLLCSLSSCEKEFYIVTETEEEQKNPTELISTTIEGNVSDLGALPLSMVLVELSVEGVVFESTVTDESGFFRLPNAKANAQTTLLSFSHPDYNKSYNIISTKEDAIQFTESRMQFSNKAELPFDVRVQVEEELYSFILEPEQIDNSTSSELVLKTSLTQDEQLRQQKIYPVMGIDSDEQSIYLDHHLIFHIELLREDATSISLLPNESFEVNFNTEIDIDNYDIWYFDESDATWYKDDFAVRSTNNLISLNKLGLYSFARKVQAQVISGTVSDAQSLGLPNTKIIITDNQGNVINETFSNSDGEFRILTQSTTGGSISFIKDGFTISTVAFDDPGNSELTSIVLAEEFPTCQDVELILDAQCQGQLAPQDLFENNVSSGQFFNLSISIAEEDLELAVLSHDENFGPISWKDIAGTSTSYTITYIPNGNSDPVTCWNIITVIDNSTPLAVCIDYLTIKLAESQATLFASDLDAGSSSSTCSGESDLEFSIARMICNENQECDLGEFASSVTFDTDDLGKEIQVVLKATDSNNNFSQCFSTVMVTE